MKRLVLLAILFAAQLTFGRGIHSGIIGESVVISCPVFGPGIEFPAHPYQNTIFIYSEKGRLLETVTTDEDGLFAVRLNPGIYTLVPAPPPQPPPPPQGIPPYVVIYPMGYPVTVEVEFKEFTTVTVIHDSGSL